MNLLTHVQALGTAVQAIGAVGSVIIALLTFYWLNLRPRPRQGEVVDQLLKHVDLQQRLLQVELSTTKDAGEQESANRRAYLAVQRYLEWADNEFERLSWEQWTDQLIHEDKLLSRLRWPGSLTWWQKAQWAWFKLLSLFFFLVAVAELLLVTFFFIRNPHSPGDLPRIALALFYFVAICLFSRAMNMTAARLVFPKKPGRTFLHRL